MRVGIVTIYNSNNCGSFLQALALQAFVSDLGYETALVKNRRYYKNKMWYRGLMACKYMALGQREKARSIIQTSRGFDRAGKQCHRVRPLKHNDACVYGSDTIWNFDSAYFGKEWKHYWGVSFDGPKIAYAPSIGPTPIESVLERRELCECLKQFDHLSVRDANTRAVVQTVMGDDAEIASVVDPTMLMPRAFYEGLAADCPDRDFILFYYFGIPDKAYMEEIRRYADANGKRLICFGDNIKGVDKQLCFDPLKMMAYFAKADMIITNTFHGNVFSLIFNKPFVNIDAGKAKVDDLLSSFGLSERTVKAACDFCGVAAKEIDYGVVGRILEEKRRESGEYLKNALKDCERGERNAR